VALGVITYYFIPLTFMYRNFSLFFTILNLILLLMILGLSFLSLLILPTLQSLLTSLFLSFFRWDRPLRRLLDKNFKAHEPRNTKTALMFVVALSFLIFAGCIFELMGRLILSQVESTMGGVDLYATSMISKEAYLDDGSIIGFLEEQRAHDGAVEAYTFGSTEMGELLLKLAPIQGKQ
jgi:hypothetical protein